MKDKNTYVGYRSDIAAARRLRDKHGADSALEFLLAIAEYSLDQHLPTFADPSAEDAFIFADIQRRVDADVEKYTAIVEKRSKAGREGGVASGEARSKTKQNEANEANASIAKQNEANEANASIAKQNEAKLSKTKQNEANEADTVSVSDAVSDAVFDAVFESQPEFQSKSVGASPRTDSPKGRPSGIEEVFQYAELLSTTETLSGRPNSFYKKDLRRYVEPFFDYWESAGWKRKGGAIKDWKASFRTWCSNELKRVNERSEHSYSKKSDTERYVLAKDLNVGDAYADPDCIAKVIEEYNATHKPKTHAW